MKNLEIKVNIKDKEVNMNGQTCSFYEAGLYYDSVGEEVDYMEDREDISDFLIEMYLERGVAVHVNFS